MKYQTIKSLIAFLIFNATFLISVNAQIVYTDVVPDVTHTCSGNSCTQTYNLDLNNDGTTDFIIKSFHHLNLTSSFIQILSQGNNLVESTSLGTVKMFSQFDSIGTTPLWNASAILKHKHSGGWNPGESGEWNNAVNKYMGLKLIVGGQIYYGWARLDVNVTLDSATFTIKDYAYNSIPNQPILAGQTTTTGITENFSSNHFSIYSFNKTLNIELNDATPLTGNITICNTLGQELKQIKIENRTMQIDMSDCNNGIYFVSVQTNEAIETKKIYLK